MNADGSPLAAASQNSLQNSAQPSPRISGPRRSFFRGPLTTNTTTSVVAAGVFVVLAAVIALAPVPYVAWSPGRTVDLAGTTADGQPLIRVDGLQTTPLNGSLRMTTVSVTRVDSQLSLPEAVLNYWLPNRDTLPREFIYPKSKSTQEVKAEEVAMMDNAQREAVVAALRAAGQPVLELPMINSVVISGPAKDLRPGDLILKVDDVAVQSVDDVVAAIQKHEVGESVVFKVERGNTQLDVTVVTGPGPKDKTAPYIGISLTVGYKHSAVVHYGIDPDIVGPSAGLIFALAIYDEVSDTDLLGGMNVAGTGTISADGTVGPIGGIQEKIAGAQKAGSDIFLVPAGNCADLAGVKTRMTLVKVTTLRDAISSLQKIKQNTSEGVPRC